MATAISSNAYHSGSIVNVSDAERTINILVATFAGLGLPRTLSLPVNASTPVGDLCTSIRKRLPPNLDEDLIITTVSNKQLLDSDARPIQDLLSSQDDTLLSIRLNRPIWGGKGGFGSQLRAAGGRMSSRKNRDRQNQNVNGSNRNLDGRRLRTIDQAKKLADYLAIKPEMDQKEQQERKQRWEAVVDAANRREDEIKSGSKKVALNEEFLDNKELAEEKTRQAIMKAMKEGTLQLQRTGSESSVDERMNSESEQNAESSSSSASPLLDIAESSSGQQFFGWDDDDEEDEDDDENDEDEDDPDEQAQLAGSGDSGTNMHYEGKGKRKAI